jgi:hypothetical protein
MEAAKNIEGFFILKITSYLACSQIWLNLSVDHSHFRCITKLTQFMNKNYIVIVVHWGVEIIFCQWTYVKMKPQLYSTLLYSTLQLCLGHWRNLYCGFKAWIVWHVTCAMFIHEAQILYYSSTLTKSSTKNETSGALLK